MRFCADRNSGTTGIRRPAPVMPFAGDDALHGPGAFCPVESFRQHSIDNSLCGDNGRAVLHGMRNSLNTLKGALTVLQVKYPEDAYLTEFLTVMEEEIRRLAELVGRVRHSGDLSPAPPSTDLNSLIKGLEDVAAGEGKVSGVRFINETEDIPRLGIDAVSAEQILRDVFARVAGEVAPGSAISMHAKLCRAGRLVHVVTEVGAAGPDGRAMQLPGLKQGDFPIARNLLRQCGGRLAVRNRNGDGTITCVYFPASGRKE